MLPGFYSPPGQGAPLAVHLIGAAMVNKQSRYLFFSRFVYLADTVTPQTCRLFMMGPKE